MTAWRIVKRRHARTAFSGEGARRYGGRWNTPGKPIVYAAGSQSLALLEILVHLEHSELLDSYVFFRIDFDAELMEDIDPAKLPRKWRSYPAPSRIQAIGDDWAAGGQKPVLRVPSVVVPAESNYLLNAAHADFGRLAISLPIPYRFDSRLV